ncbi:MULTISPECIES: glutathione S-transferase N-terminal domain-containing protein [Pseudomonas]|uniref:glutathione S-transferase family protein n=1 Tax=Pseudomonas TaxID=286 RepID=UPI000CD4D8AB|nr:MULTISPECIES: glutathione S-transferase N-terminal domain-containing protein [Pseudomonas]MPQ71106.1 glutathione S-transferase family protein [Pseudomonas sp. MWU12-2323]RBH55856.1 glutathione S-transferase family protein [Pseudomonas sp. MWU13-2860]
MKLIGMLDSPYVRRVAITLKHLGIAFEHQSVSVFRDFERFAQINPVVKAPTLVCDSGEVLMDSGLILEYLALIAGPGQAYASLAEQVRGLRLIGLALAACEKSVQIVYEKNLRPAEKQHGPWLERVGGQLAAAYTQIENELSRQQLPQDGTIRQEGISLAVAWSFSKMMLPEQCLATHYPHLEQFTAYAERLEIFVSTPAT